MSYCTSGIFQSYAYMGLEHSESLEHATSAFVTCNDIRNLHSEKWCVPSKKLEKIEDIYLGTKYYNNILTLKDDIFCVFLANGQLMRMFYTNQCYDSTQNLSRWSLIPLFLDYCLMDGLFCSELDLGHHNCRIQLSNDFSSIYTFDCQLVVWSSTICWKTYQQAISFAFQATKLRRAFKISIIWASFYVLVFHTILNQILTRASTQEFLLDVTQPSSVNNSSRKQI